MSMERTRYFRSANQFNVFVNFFSGNIFPLGEEKIKLTFLPILWVIFVWTFKILTISTVMSGSLYFANLPLRERINKSGPGISVCVELMIPVIYLNLRREDLQNLINKYNSILVDSDELRNLVLVTLEPYKKGLKFYIVACAIAVTAWAVTPLLTISNKDQYTYADFSAPAYFPGAPFSSNIFRVTVISQTVGSFFITVGKISIDVYINHLIAVLSAEYKYLRTLITEALSRENDQEDELSVIRALHKCIGHHCAVIEIGQDLGDILALQIGTTYILCIFKLCFLAFGVITFGSANIEKVTYVVYAIGCVLQIFILCSCIQELLDVSTSVTDDAFHENWHGRGSRVKKIFCIMEMSSQMGCRLSAYQIVDLVVPTVGVILSKSYSVCLLLLEVN